MLRNESGARSSNPTKQTRKKNAKNTKEYKTPKQRQERNIQIQSTTKVHMPVGGADSPRGEREAQIKMKVNQKYRSHQLRFKAKW